MATALLRSVPESFRHAITSDRGRAPDVELARIQHARYRGHLEAADYDIEVLDADEDHPDCLFIEDPAVVMGPVALITRPGAPSRRGEVAAVAAALSKWFRLAEVQPPGTLDGGDVMRLGDTVWVGLSDRTNAEGARQLAAVTAELGLRIVEVPVRGVLHLKSGVSPIDGETVVVTPGAFDEDLLHGLRVIEEVEAERYRFSALPLNSGVVMVTESAPRTSERLAALGHQVVPIDVSEIQAADGGLTCMSILF
jgi:dimethylargininase